MVTELAYWKMQLFAEDLFSSEGSENSPGKESETRDCRTTCVPFASKVLAAGCGSYAIEGKTGTLEMPESARL